MRILLRHWLQLVALAAALLAVQCGRSDPLACRNDCDEEGEKRCQESVVEVCARAANGCLNWTDAVDCAEGGGVCVDDSGEVRCLYPCQDEPCSTVGERRCDGNTVQSCAVLPSGCLGWEDVETCGPPTTCQEGHGWAQCMVTCADECGEDGKTRCSGAVVQRCSPGQDGCLRWTDGTDCSQAGDLCAEVEGGAACVCQDGCSPEHATRCSGTAVHVCERGTRGCLVWFFQEDCGSAGKVCDDSSGEAVCVCRHECAAEGESKCSGAVVQKCTRLQNGCLAWRDDTDCAAQDLVCEMEGGQAVCRPCRPDCAGRECGPDPRCGESCGDCAGSTEICSESSGQCIDLCAGKECGPSGGFDCGSCPEGEVCVENACFAPHCEDGMCHVPAGTFWMGCNEEVDFMCRPDEYPYHPVFLSSFWIDQYEVTQTEYLACFLAGKCGNTPPCFFDPETHPEIPVVCMGIQGAQNYCEFVGKRLCTEAEWEKAARGTDGRRYPWGNQPATCELAVFNDGSPGCGTSSYFPVGSKPAGASPFGLLDVAGNAAEVVQDYYSENYYQECSEGCVDPQGPPRPPESSPRRVVRGGYYESWPQQVRVSSRNYTNDGLGYWIGFRCCN